MLRIRANVYHGWYVLAAVSGINFANAATAIGVLTVFVLPLSEEFGWSRTEIAAVTSVGALLGAAVSPATGVLTDRLGARLPLAAGAIMVVVAMLNLAAMQNLLWFYFAFGLARLADQAFVQTPSAPAVAKWFVRYRGRALAVLYFAASAGGIALPLMAGSIIDAWDWRAAWVMLAAVMAAIGLLPTLTLVRRQPEDMGLSVDGGAYADTPAVERDFSERDDSDTAEPVWSLSEASRTPTLWLLQTAIFAMGVVGSGVMLHLVPHLVQRGIQNTVAVGVVSTIFMSAALGSAASGLLSDRLSTRGLVVAAFALRVGGIALLLTVGSVAEAYGFAVIMGFTEGGSRTLTTKLLADYYGRRSLGVIYGLVRAIQVGGMALGTVLAGLVFDLSGEYDAAIVVFLALVALGTVLVALSRQPRHPAARPAV